MRYSLDACNEKYCNLANKLPSIDGKSYHSCLKIYCSEGNYQGVYKMEKLKHNSLLLLEKLRPMLNKTHEYDFRKRPSSVELYNGRFKILKASFF